MQKTADRLTPANLDLKAAGVLFGCCMIWGVGLVMAKLASGGISAVFNAGLRSLIAGCLLFAISLLRGVPLFARDRTTMAGVVCGVLFALEFVFLYLGLDRTPVSRGTIFLHCAPFVAALGEHLFVPGHRLSGIRAVGLATAFAGLVVAMGDGFSANGDGSILGDFYCLLGGIFWGATTVVVRATALRSAPAEKTLLYQLAVSAPILLAWSFMVGETGIGTLTPIVIGAFAYTVVAVVLIGYLTWFWLMRTYSAASLHAFTFLSPIFGVIAGAVLLAEPITPALLSGLALVALGIYLVNRPERA